jgi:predicted alpha/beta-fold hydrolase
MGDVQQHLGHRFIPVARGLDKSLGRERAQNRIDPPRHVRPYLQHVGFRRSPAGGKLGIAVANGRRSPDHVLEEITIRSRDMQHKVANRIRQIVRTPPEIVLAQHVETAFDLSGKFRDQPSGDVLEKELVDRIGHLVMISSNVHLPQPGHAQHRIRVTFTLSEFRPRFTGGHIQTLYAWARPRSFSRLPAPAARYFDVAADARVLAHCHWHDRPDEHPTLLLLHGLEGSSLAHYMGGMADKAWARGWNVVRLNQRNCGDTEHLSRGLYHSGLTHDPLFVMRELIVRDGIRAIAVAGYSLGGNLTLKLAGDLGEHTPPELKAVCAVSPTMDLAVCVDALERRSNLAYQWNFVRRLKARMRRKAAVVPEVFTLKPLRRIWTVRQFDEAYTAPHHGFRNAADYYHRASAMRVVDRIRVPALILTAEDDPFVPVAPFRHPAVTGNPCVTTIVTRHGGHCAFVGHAAGEYDGYWAEEEVVRFVTAHASGPSASVQTPAPSLPLRA